MNKKMIIILAIIGLITLSVIFSYNSLIDLNEDTNSKWSQVENQLQRRSDLIPNIANTVKGYSTHEQKIFSDVANARSKLLNAEGVASKAEANKNLTIGLGRLLMIAENYPQLKADVNFRQLQDELAGTENRLAVTRKDYNESVQIFNSKIKSFPINIFAAILGFNFKQYFKTAEGTQTAPLVKF